MIIKEIQVKNILTKSNLPIAGYSINPYIGCSHACKYCYAAFMKRFTKHDEPWGSFVDVKYWEPIKNPQKYAGKTMIIGSVTDGYLPQEAIYKRTRAFLKEMQGSNINLIITTKSDLVVRDLDLIKTYPNPLIAWSIDSLDENFKKEMDHAPSIQRRIEALKTCHEAGIRTSCFISPIFPGITDVEDIIDKIAPYCQYIWLENLNLRGGFKKDILDYIKNNYPKLEELYQEIYNKNNLTYWTKLSQEIEEYTKQRGYTYVIDKEPFLDKIYALPIIINYFYHAQIKQSAKKV